MPINFNLPLKIKITFLFLFYFSLTTAICQNKFQTYPIDTLWDIWNNNKEADTNRYFAIENIIKRNLFSKPDSVLIYSNMLLKFAELNKLLKYKANAIHFIGSAYYIKSDYGNALVNYEKSLSIREKIKDKEGIANSLNNIGEIRRNQANYKESIKCMTKSLKIREEIGDSKGVAMSLGNIGELHKNLQEYDKAIEYHSKSLEIREAINDKNGIILSLNNIGVILKIKGDFESAKSYFLNAYKKSEETENQYQLANSSINLGNVYFHVNDFISAKKYYFKALEIQRKTGDIQGQSITYGNLGNIFEKQKDIKTAISYFEKMLEASTQINSVLQIRDASKELYTLSKKTKQAEKALKYLEIFIVLKDSINFIENKKFVFEQEIKYNYDKKAIADSISFANQKRINEVEIANQKLEIKSKRNQQYALLGGLVLFLFFSIFLFNRFRITQKQKGIIEEQKYLVEEKQKEILDSITYAKRIQQAILTPLEDIEKHLPNSFLLYKPKDIVAGDFYFFEFVNNTIFYAAADCTGHGVPGAMVSVVCANALTRSVKEFGLSKPREILDNTRELVLQTFTKSSKDVKDGMDISFCKLEISKSKNINLEWAGANNPLWIIRKTVIASEENIITSSSQMNDGVSRNNSKYKLIEYKPNKQPIGKTDNPLPFTTHAIELQKDDAVYIFTDGYQDQFGGEKNKKFKTSKLKELLLSVQHENFSKQKEILIHAFENWKGTMEQVDDICIIGFRV